MPAVDARQTAAGPRRAAICIVSTTSGLALGGLPTYVRLLAAELARVRPTSAVARFARDPSRGLDTGAAEPPRSLTQAGGVALTIVAPARHRRALASLARRLSHHPRGHPLAVRCVVGSHGAALAAAVPSDVGVVHWVGSGWELLGFAAERVARERGAAFTVLPAIHAGTWGDGPLDARLYASADRVIALSASERALLERLGVRGDRIDVTGLGPAVGDGGDAAAFRARHGLGRRPLVLFVGRKDATKGFDVLCEAVLRLRRTRPDATLVALGPPGGMPPCGAGGAPAVVDLGPAGDDEKADALAACDVLCLPSRGESFGIACVEAWRYGKPVVVGPSPASRELVEHGVTGLHVEQDPDAIEAALLELLGDPARSAAMGARGRALQRERYTWPVTCRRHLDSFEKAALAASRSGRDERPVT